MTTAVAADWDALVDAHAFGYLGIPASTIRWWAQRGLLEQRGRDGRRVLYRAGDVVDLHRGVCPVRDTPRHARAA